MPNEATTGKRMSAWGWTVRAAVLLAALLPWGNTGLTQRAGTLPPGAHRIAESLLDRSLPGLVSDGWQVMAVSQSGPAFAYHLVHEGGLAICYVSLADQPLNSLCYRLNAAP